MEKRKDEELLKRKKLGACQSAELQQFVSRETWWIYRHLQKIKLYIFCIQPFHTIFCLQCCCCCCSAYLLPCSFKLLIYSKWKTFSCYGHRRNTHCTHKQANWISICAHSSFIFRMHACMPGIRYNAKQIHVRF